MFKNVSYKTQRKFIIALFLLIPLTLLFVFTYLPAINMISYSFTNWKGYGAKTFIGLENYINIFSDPEIFSVLKAGAYDYITTIKDTQKYKQKIKDIVLWNWYQKNMVSTQRL